jgi:uncharacterized membrane protein (UPF0127 family)
MMLSACGTSDLILSSFDGSNSVNVQVEVADNAKERTQGLMNRAELKADTGMLFIFPKPHVLTFWMKNTKIPLEILFFDAEGAFVNAYTMQPCIEDPCDTYKAAALSAYALEVNPGFREMNGIGVGWKLDPKEVAKISKPQ